MSACTANSNRHWDLHSLPRKNKHDPRLEDTPLEAVRLLLEAEMGQLVPKAE